MCSAMFSRTIVWFLFLIPTSLSNESTRENVHGLSTTNRPPPTDNTKDFNNRLIKLLNSLESQVALIQKTNSNTQSLPRNCKEIQDRGQNVSNVYFIQPKIAPEPFLVLCNMETKEGGWTYILNRFNGSQNFDQNWKSYKHGFGIPDSEFWLGLQNIHYLTGSEINELLIELVDWDLKEVYALYSSFSIGNEQEGYSIKLLRGYSGDAGDCLTYHLGMKFSTKDKDHDLLSGNCAKYSRAGWWYKGCSEGQLTGQYLGIKVVDGDNFKSMYWDTFHGHRYSLKEARMMIRPIV